MKYVGRLVVLAQAALMASWVSAGTVTLNGLSCGSTTSNVVINASGDITLSTNDDDQLCAWRQRRHRPVRVERDGRPAPARKVR